MSVHGRKLIWLGGLATLLASIGVVAAVVWVRGRNQPLRPRIGPAIATAPAQARPGPLAGTAEPAKPTATKTIAPAPLRGPVADASASASPLPPSAKPAVPALAPAASASRPEGRQVWALLVGIEDYRDAVAFPSCPGAAQDAISMARWLIDEAGWSPANVLLLTDRKPRFLAAFPDPARRPEHREPTRSELARGTREWLPSRARKGDVVLVFFAGQAISLDEGRPGPAERDYLVPWDARANRIEEDGWRLGDAIEETAARGDVAIVCLLDTSPLGRNRPPERLGRGAKVPPALRRRMLEGIARWPGVTAWMAATEKPAAVRAGHGLLTGAFLEAIGLRAEGRNLQACLQRLRHDPDLVGQGFQAVGGFGPELGLWPGAGRPPLARADPLLQRGHSDQVTALAFSNDGGRLFSASLDSTVRIWRWRDRSALLLRVLPGTMNGFWSLALSGDGRLLAAGGGDGGLLFYDLQGHDVRLTSWGDGSKAPASGRNVIVAGLDDDGLLHVRTFDSAGARTDAYEEMEDGVSHLIVEGPSGTSDAPGPSLSAAQTRAIANLKRRLAGPSPSRVLDDAERSAVLDEATLITGKAHFAHEGVRSTARRFPHAGPVDRIAVLWDGRHVLALDNTGKALLWDARTAEARQVAQVADGKDEAALRFATARLGNAGAAFAAVIDRTNEKRADHREVLRLFDLQGKLLAEPAGVPGRISALCLSDDGKRTVVGTVDGQVAEFGPRGEAIAPARRLADGRIDYLSLQPRWMVVGSGGTLRIVPEEKGRAGTTLELGEPIVRVVCSDDGRRVAACGQYEGRLRVWDIAADGGSHTVLDLKQDPKDVLSLGFSPDGAALVAGGASGEVRSWRLPSGTPRPAIAAHRDAGVGHIAVAPDARALLQVSRGGTASLWEFGAEGNRGARRLPGAFRPAGGFLPGAGGDLVLITKAGQVVVVDRARGERRDRAFEWPANRSGTGALEAEFDALTIARDGRWVAAVSHRRRLACVWDVATGRLLLQTIRDRESGVSDVVSSDGRRWLLTAGPADGRAQVWDLGDDGPPPGPGRPLVAARPVRALPPDGAKEGRAPSRPVSAAAFSPNVPDQIAIGREDGAIELWDLGANQPRTVPKLQRRVAAVAFSPDGRYLVAAGDDHQIVVRAVANLDAPILLGRGPNHFERTNSLAFWPSGKLFLSASDDTTVRLWKLGDWSLLGTLASSLDRGEWSVFTPNGLFDASPEGQARVTWRLATEEWPAVPEGPVVSLEQLFQQRYCFDLAETLVTDARAPDPPERPTEAPPRVALEQTSAPGPGERRVKLRIRMSKPGTVPRLYHNGVVVGRDLKVDGQVAEATVELVAGKNRIYAMAGLARPRPDRPAAVDGRSDDLELVYAGETPGRTHVLALGVSRYRSQALRYADADARAFADFLKRGRFEGAVGASIVLRDEQVTREAVDRAFEELRSEAKAEDTVVIFLAGHTAIRRGLFCLLLPNAEMPAGPDIVALRALVGTPPVGARISSPTEDPGLLPYSTVPRQLSMVAALRRLIIIDACEAELIHDDPTVRALADRESLRQAETSAQRYRTSYILATRRGEREPEPTELEHGLLTYVLLRGMGDDQIKRPEGLTIFERFPTADFNGDQWIETGELQRYARATVPVLAERFTGRHRRGDDDSRRGASGASGAQAGVSPNDPASSFLLIKAPGADGRH